MSTVRWNPQADPFQAGMGATPLGLNFGANASDTFAAMTRDMWAQWVRQFMPIENTLIDYASDETLPETNATKAIAGVQAAFAQGSKTQQLSMKTSGLQYTDEEKKQIARDRSLDQSLAEVQAANTARGLTIDRQRSIMGVPVNTGDLAIRGGK
jgi:hypothetical protein